MVKPLKSYVLRSLLAVMLFSSLSIVACSKHPNEEQLQALEESKRAALSAEEQLAQKKRERDDLQRQVDQKKAELQKAEAEKEAINSRLGQN